MNLHQCRLGEIVRESHVLADGRIGHIVGLTSNPEGHVIPLVRFATRNKDESIHHANLSLLIDHPLP